MVKLITRTLKHEGYNRLMFFISKEYCDIQNLIDAAFIDHSATYHGENKEVLYIVEVVHEQVFDDLQYVWQRTIAAEQERWDNVGIKYTETIQDVVDQK
jgi:predicted RNA-binding protein with PUA-like domain